MTTTPVGGKTPAGGKSALYRGVVVDRKDPLGQGRLRVKVPQVFGEQVSGWAFPAWPVGDLTIWPEDRLPANGQGVWIIFESWDHLAWVAIFGPVEDVPPDDAANYTSVLTWELPVIPEGTEITIPGILTSKKAGTPNPDPIVVIERSPSGLGAWEEIGVAQPDPKTGKWGFAYTRADPGTWWYRAYFEGTEPFTDAQVGPQKPPEPTFEAVLTVDPYTPVWNAAATITGILRNKSDNAVLGNDNIQLFDRRNNGPWLKVSQTKTGTDGRWAIPYTRPDQYAFDLKAVFPGSQTHIYTEVSSSYPIMSVPVQTTITVPPLGVRTTVNVTGTVSSPYGVPRPGARVQFQVRRPPDTGTWVAAAGTAAPNATTGAWTLPYTSQYGLAQYRAVVSATDVFQEGVSAVSSQDVRRSTTTSAPAFGGLFFGGAATATGLVRESPNTSVSATGGTVKLFGRQSGATTWIDYTSPQANTAVASNGSYSVLSKNLDFTGSAEWKVEYLGDGNYYFPSTSPTATASVSAGTITNFRGTSISHSSATVSWNESVGATSYEVQGQTNSGAWSTLQNSAATSFTRNGLAQDTAYGFRARALAGAAAGSWSNTVTANTGHAAVPKSGSFIYETRPSATNSYRPDTGWGYIGDDVAQGYFSQSNRNYTGVMSYDGPAFQNWVRTHYGQDVLNNLTWVASTVAMYRKTGSGNNAAVPIRWHVTGTWAGTGGQPSLAGGADSAGLAVGAAAYLTLPYAHWAGHVLLNQNVAGAGICNGLAIYSFGTGNYSQYEGVSGAGNACNLAVNCSWNFIALSASAPFWS